MIVSYEMHNPYNLALLAAVLPLAPFLSDPGQVGFFKCVQNTCTRTGKMSVVELGPSLPFTQEAFLTTEGIEG